MKDLIFNPSFLLYIFRFFDRLSVGFAFCKAGAFAYEWVMCSFPKFRAAFLCKKFFKIK